jgi:hypothetical protein
MSRGVCFGGIEALLRAGEHFRHAAGMARRRDAADGHGDRDRAGAGRHHVVAHPASMRSAAIAMSSGVQSRSTMPNLLPEKAAERVLAAHPAAHALGDRADHLIGDIEAVGLVDARQIVDRDQQEAAGRAEAHRFVEGVFENLGEVMAVQLAGQAVVAREIGEPALVLVALVDDAHDAVRARRLAVGADKPAAGVLDPKLGFGAGSGRMQY